MTMYDNLREKAEDMALEIEELKAKVNDLEEMNAVLRGIVDTQKETISTYAKVFLIQEAEIESLRGKNDDKL